MKTKWMAVGTLALAGLLAAPGTSNARVVIRFGHEHHAPSAFQIGLERGREDGWRRGERDARHNCRPSYWNDNRYRNADHGYKRHYGPRHVYASGYRDGYESAYRAAYRQTARRMDRHDRWDDNDYARRW
jgi:hypothetical protein